MSHRGRGISQASKKEGWQRQKRIKKIILPYAAVYLMGVITGANYSIAPLFVPSAPDKNSHAEFEKNAASASTNSSTTNVIAQALRQIKLSISDDNNPATVCPTEVWIYEGPIGGPGRRFPCSGILPWKQENATSGPYLHGCGDGHKVTHHIYPFASNPFIWECRLKERLELAIRQHNLSDCAFGFLDVGSASGDWVVVLSGHSKRAKFAAVEAHPSTFLDMLRNFHANNLLSEGRLSAYPFAAGVMAVEATTEGISVDVSWPESKFIRVSNWPGSTLCMPHGLKNAGTFQTSKLQVSDSVCKERETNVPIVSIDMIMSDWQRQKGDRESGSDSQLSFGGLFAVKVDIEGAERESILGAMKAFGDPQQRPCQLYIELKIGTAYAEAVDLLLSLGYNDYIDVDSGKSGLSSYPPVGELWDREGNYEFRLPVNEFEKCVERVRTSACLSRQLKGSKSMDE